jgi:thiol:disulfide interchange protein
MKLADKAAFGIGATTIGLFLLVGCAPESTPQKPAKNASLPPNTGGTVAAFHDLSLEKALERAKSEGKLVMVDFYADWCGPCKMLDSKTWPDPKVQSWLTEHAVAIKINIDQHKEIAAQYNVSSIPLLVFIKPDGTVAGDLLGFRGPADFLKAADGVLKK